MSIGSRVRRLFGANEHAVAELYRSIFVDLDDLTKRIAGWAAPETILEIGCGEGALAERLTAAFPAARYLGVDVSPNAGRLFRGDDARAEFRCVMSSEVEGAFDLVVLNDVLHHVPQPLRPDILADARRLLAPGGVFVMKDWLRRPTPIHGLVYAADVWIGGDENVAYMRMDEQKALIEAAFGSGAVREEAPVRPWRQNHAFLVKPDPD